MMEKIRNGKVQNITLVEDYQIVLNTILHLFYKLGDYIFLDEAIKKIDYPFSEIDIYTAYDNLIEDGYIIHQTPDIPRNFTLRVAKITGKGRLFFEAGGYSDGTTQFDKIINWAKNNKIIAYGLIGMMVLAGLKEVFDIVIIVLEIGK